MGVTADLLVRFEAAAQERMYAHRIEVVRGNHTSGKTLGPIAAGAQSGADDFFGDERINQRATSAEVQEVRPGYVGSFRGPRNGAAEDQQFVLVDDERIGPEQDAFDPTVDGGICADTDREAG